jgi:hypothetical protein
MGLDDVDNLARAIAVFALVTAVFVGAGAVFLSVYAFRWSLRLVAEHRSVRPAQILSTAVLIVSGLPGAVGVAALLFTPMLGLVAVPALAAVIHAAYRDECIRKIGKNRALARALSNVPHAAKRSEHIRTALEDFELPRFTGQTRRRALLRTLAVVGAWGLGLGALGLVATIAANAG